MRHWGGTSLQMSVRCLSWPASSPPILSLVHTRINTSFPNIWSGGLLVLGVLLLALLVVLGIGSEVQGRGISILDVMALQVIGMGGLGIGSCTFGSRLGFGLCFGLRFGLGGRFRFGGFCLCCFALCCGFCLGA